MKKFEFFDDLELRSTEQRNEDHLKQLTRLIQEAKKNKNQLSRLNKEVKDLSDLELIPVLRKSDLIEKQSESLPFAELNVSEIIKFKHIYRSPGPIL
ncbi:hypothetical protein N9C42_02680 [Alphaproteobacteria bacterium]|nr:hypothetical protein [Alphaproteobacteria bacterium]